MRIVTRSFDEVVYVPPQKSFGEISRCSVPSGIGGGPFAIWSAFGRSSVRAEAPPAAAPARSPTASVRNAARRARRGRPALRSHLGGPSGIDGGVGPCPLGVMRGILPARSQKPLGRR